MFRRLHRQVGHHTAAHKTPHTTYNRTNNLRAASNLLKSMFDRMRIAVYVQLFTYVLAALPVVLSICLCVCVCPSIHTQSSAAAATATTALFSFA
jgi:hypothetical protein